MFSQTWAYSQAWKATDVTVYDTFEDIEKNFALSDDSIHVINFWATWCKPCVAELPFFEEAVDLTSKRAVKFTYISLDFAKHIETRVIPLLNNMKISANVVLLADGKYNNWIDKVDPSWSGAIPATVIIQGNKKIFFEGSFHSNEEIIELIKKIKTQS